MRDFVITTETNSDLPQSYLKEKEIGIISHYYEVNGTVYGEENLLTDKEFYDEMRKGVMPTTMASNPAVIRDVFKNYVNQGKDVLHISFSSALSGGYSNVAIGAKEICEEYEGANIIVIDTLNASLGEGMVIRKAVTMKEEGKSIDEIVQWIEQNKLNFCVQFTVDDLFHLHRGGRVSKATAVIGSIVNVKPILYINDEGSLVSLTTVRGRKRSLSTLVSNMEKSMGRYIDSDDPICIVHGDVEEDASYLESLLKEKYPNKEVIINTIGPSIGAHSGPGAVGLCYMGEKR
ncbi:MAG TPA: DegV family protein [Lachnospiraceae bacterium]|nr:DegV family protein [Lachnospiraceae bacterium]